MLDGPDHAPPDLTVRLLTWFDGARRDLPWREAAAPGEAQRRDPYRVWLSEIMLQQTTVAAVVPYFEAFLDRWPRVTDLAGASLDDVLVAWAGLGYYARARNLHKCARHVAENLGGRFPDTYDGLRALPGIGPYTAGAIAAIAFGEAVPAVDGNVVRVLSRLRAVETPMPSARAEIEGHMRDLLPPDRPGDFAEALMDLGAGVCTPRTPGCSACPWMDDCRAYAKQAVETYPRRHPKKEKPTRRGVAYWVMREDGTILLRRRPERGLLGGMMEIPSTDWGADFPSDAEIRAMAPLEAAWQVVPGLVRHTFTHFHLELRVVAGRAGAQARTNGLWCAPDDLNTQALPTVMKKVVKISEKYNL